MPCEQYGSHDQRQPDAEEIDHDLRHALVVFVASDVGLDFRALQRQAQTVEVTLETEIRR